MGLKSVKKQFLNGIYILAPIETSHRILTENRLFINIILLFRESKEANHQPYKYSEGPIALSM
jgi:hypothetical protein